MITRFFHLLLVTHFSLFLTRHACILLHACLVRNIIFEIGLLRLTTHRVIIISCGRCFCSRGCQLSRRFVSKCEETLPHRRRLVDGSSRGRNANARIEHDMPVICRPSVPVVFFSFFKFSSLKVCNIL